MNNLFEQDLEDVKFGDKVLVEKGLQRFVYSFVTCYQNKVVISGCKGNQAIVPAHRVHPAL